jgi:hypothetical protein
MTHFYEHNKLRLTRLHHDSWLMRISLLLPTYLTSSMSRHHDLAIKSTLFLFWLKFSFPHSGFCPSLSFDKLFFGEERSWVSPEIVVYANYWPRFYRQLSPNFSSSYSITSDNILSAHEEYTFFFAKKNIFNFLFRYTYAWNRSLALQTIIK